MTKKSFLITLICTILAVIVAAYFVYLLSSSADQEEINVAPIAPIEQPISNSDNPIAPPDDKEPEQTLEEKPPGNIDIALMSQVEDLTLDEKIGQLIIAGIDGTKINNNTKILLDHYKVGNLIMFKRNLKNEQQIKEFTTELHQYPSSTIPLWISIDQEGGVVNRLPQSFPSAQELGNTDSLETTQQVGLEMGTMLHKLGFQVDFAPVLDINSNPKNPIIGSRAYGNTAEIVNKHSLATIQALQNQNIIAVGKHFPGHGDTKEDSHLTLPVIDKTWNELMTLELLPFIHAIDHQIDGIMVSHLLVPEVDQQYPASLSFEFITNKLRGKLNFDGLIITDDLEMKGITNDYSVGEAAVLAIQAGADMVIIGHKLDRQQDAFEQIKLAVSNETIDIEEINEHVYRILSYKLAKKIE